MQSNSSRTLQQYLQQRRRNASLQQLYNIGNSVGMGVVGHITTPTRYLPLTKVLLHKTLRGIKFSLLLVCCDLVEQPFPVSSVYLIDKDSALLLTTKFVIVFA